jgi:DNA-binding PadR family transcriptional regulator
VSHPSAPESPVDAALPLKPADYFILFVLVEGERHGYWMAKEIERLTEGQVRLEAGNLYRSLRRMMKSGWVRQSDRRPAAESDDERRRYYGVTELGRQIVRAEVERMRAVVEMAEAQSAARSDGR